MNLVDEASDSKFVTRKSNILYDYSNTNHDAWNEIIYNTEVLKSSLCDFNDAYIFVRGNITIVNDNGTQAVFKNCAPFTKCITKIDVTTIDDAET